MENFSPDESILAASHLLDNLGVGLIICDLKENIKFANKCANTLFGSDDESFLINKNLFDFVDRDTADLIVFQTEKRKKGEKSIYEITINLKNNQTRTINITALPYYNDKQEVIGVFGVFIDGTELKTYEKKYQDILEIYQGLFDNVTEAVYIQDRDGKFLDVNLGASKMYGYTREEMINKSPLDLSAEGMNDLEKIKIAVQTAYNGENQIFEFWGKRKNGEIFPKEVRLYPANYFGQKVVLALATDITHRKLSEENLAKITNTLLSFGPDSYENLRKLLSLCSNLFKADIVLFNKFDINDYATTIVSHTAEQELPYEEEIKNIIYEKFKEKKLIDIYKINSEELNTLFKNVNLDIKDIIICPISINENIIGSLTLIYKKNYSISDFEKRYLDIICGAISVEEKRRLSELALKISKETLIETNAAKDKFFNLIAHDLKNPFHSILGLTDIMVDEYDLISDDKKKKFIININSVAKDTYKLLENLLEWARTQTGKIEYRPTFFDIYNVLTEVCNLLHAQAFNKDIQLLPAIPMNTMAYADTKMVHTILRNLISNAIKFSFPHGNIIITSENIDDQVIISVIDKGTGIKQDHLGKLFKIDQQVKTDGTANEKGSGIGLLICKELVERNKGKIWVTSEYGKGSIFYFSLPTTSN